MKLSVELCQLRMEPLYPDRVNVPEFDPAQYCVFDVDMLPPTEVPATVTMAIPDRVEAQPPFCITALKLVVVVRLLKF